MCSLALDRGEDRLEQRAKIVGRTRGAPEAGEVDRGAQFEDACFLAAGDVDRREEAGFRLHKVCCWPLERKLAVEPMQLGKPEPLTRLLSESVQYCVSTRHMPDDEKAPAR